MRFGAALVLCSVAGFAQAPPPDVDEALRARVTEFFGYHVTGDFEKAWPMVADNSKKEYFSAQKTLYKSFKIDSVKYSDQFTKATATLTVSEEKRVNVRFPPTVFTYPVETEWKVENGKWCWYNDHKFETTWKTPMGPSDAAKGGSSGNATVNTIAPDQIANRAKAIFMQSGLDRGELTLAANKESSDQAVFKNGQGGSIQLALAQTKLPAGMTATLDKNEVGNGDQAVLKVSYKPREDEAPPAQTTLILVMEPFSRQIPVVVKFTPAH